MLLAELEFAAAPAVTAAPAAVEAPRGTNDDRENDVRDSTTVACDEACDEDCDTAVLTVADVVLSVTTESAFVFTEATLSAESDPAQDVRMEDTGV